MKSGRIILCILIFMQLCCTKDENRRIKLSSSPEQSFMQDDVTTIRVAIANKKSVAILGFKNGTQDSELDWLEQGIVEMFQDDLEQSRYLYIIKGNEIERMRLQVGKMSRPLQIPVLSSMAKSIDAEVVICGNYFFKQDSLKIQLLLYDTRRDKLLLSETQSGSSLSSIFSIVTDLILRVKDSLQISRIEDRQLAESEMDYRSAYLATRSLEAYKHYTKGIEYANKIYHSQAITCFENAIAIDSTFVSAYHKLAFAYAAIGNLDRARSIVRKGKAFIDSAPLRERSIYLAYEAFMNGDFYHAIRYYEEVCSTYPEDGESHYNLSVIYHNLQIHEKAIEHAKAALAMGYEKTVVLNNLGYTYQEIGKHDYAKKAIREYMNLLPDEPNPHDSMGDILRSQGNFDAAIEEYKKALSLDKSFSFSRLGMAGAYLDKGDYQTVENILKKIKTNPDTPLGLRATLLIIQSHILQEKVDAAKKVLMDMNDSMPYNSTVMYFLAEIFPNCKDLSARMDRLINYVKQNPRHIQTFDRFFNFVLCCFKADYGLEFAREFVNQAYSNSSNVFMKFSILGFRQILEMNSKNPDIESMGSFRSDISAKALDFFPPVSWEDYFKYYHLGFINIAPHISDDRTLQEMLQAIDTIQDKNFKLQAYLGYINLLALKGDSSAVQKHLERIGMPHENRWMILPAFKNTRSFHHSFWPERTTVKNIVSNRDGTKFLPQPDGISDGYVDLYSLSPDKFNQTYYALLPIVSPESQNVQLRLGANRPIKVWLDDELVFVNNRYDRCFIDRYKFSVRLRSGVNWIMIKGTSSWGEHGFYFRVTDEQGEPIPDLDFATALGLFADCSMQRRQ